MLTLTGSLSAGNAAYVYSDGHAQLGMIDAGSNIWVDVYGTNFGINDAWTAGNADRRVLAAGADEAAADRAC